MATEGTTDDLEKQLLHILRFSGIDDDNLHELVKIVVGLNGNGLENLRVFPLGTPVPDGLNVQSTVSAPNIGGVLNSILSQTPRLGSVVIFPYGIVNPEVFQVNVALGAAAASGAEGL